MSRFAKALRFPALALGLALAAGILFACGEGDAGTEAPATQPPTEEAAATAPATQQPTEQAASTAPPTQPQPEVGHETGQRAPNFMVATADGGQLSLDSFQGRPVLLYFSATW